MFTALVAVHTAYKSSYLHYIHHIITKCKYKSLLCISSTVSHHLSDNITLVPSSGINHNDWMKQRTLTNSKWAAYRPGTTCGADSLVMPGSAWYSRGLRSFNSWPWKLMPSNASAFVHSSTDRNCTAIIIIINSLIPDMHNAHLAHKQEVWLSPTERESVSAISLRHILASSGYAPGTIAVNVTWIERGFNAGQMHSSIYPFIFNRLRTIARYCRKLQLFSYALHLTPPLGVFPLEFPEKVSTTRVDGRSWQMTGFHYPSTRPVNTASGNRAPVNTACVYG